MPEVLGNPPSPRTALFWNGTAWQWARVDAQGHLQIDVLSTAMDALAATAANQATMITALQLIDNLVVALGGPANARLIVRGEDQLFSLLSVLAVSRSADVSGADGTGDSNLVTAGRYWIVTNIAAQDITNPLTGIGLYKRHDAASYAFHEERRAVAAGEYITWSGQAYLDPGDYIRVHFQGSQAGDSCRVVLTGYQMTLET